MWPKAMFDDVMLVLQISLEMHVTAWVGRKKKELSAAVTRTEEGI